MKMKPGLFLLFFFHELKHTKLDSVRPIPEPSAFDFFLNPFLNVFPDCCENSDVSKAKRFFLDLENSPSEHAIIRFPC